MFQSLRPVLYLCCAVPCVHHNHRAQPEEAKEGGSVGVVQWGEREELKDLYALFCDKVGADD